MVKNKPFCASTTYPVKSFSFAGMLINEDQREITAVGLMSGTSMDGIDLAACTFFLRGNQWNYSLHKAITIPYSKEWEQRLSELPGAGASAVFETNAALGRLFGNQVLDFLRDLPVKAELIASHGHTLFHRPDRDYTVQIGSGAHIAAVCNLPVVCDFRLKDVALGGQGAPLVPVGDHFLFSNYEACLNLGGISNISMMSGKERIAFDICPVNMALNFLARKEGKTYDSNGDLARNGNILEDKLEQLNELAFYKISSAKSLGREWFEQHFYPILSSGNTADLCRTVCEHIADQHARVFNKLPEGATILVTGGGAYNTFLLERMAQKTTKRLHVPERELVEFKEAIVFAFLGVLNYWDSVNVFDSATGSVKKHIGGALYKGD